MSECPYKLRSDIPAPPASLAHLPIGKRGYPVPPFVEVINGEPDFRVVSMRFVERVERERLCFVCGRPRGQENPVFITGPLSLLSRACIEPSMHAECARYSAQTCPFITKPQMERRETDRPEGLASPLAIQILTNPGVYALAFTRAYRIDILRNGAPIWYFGTSLYAVEWMKAGRRATRAEVAQAYQMDAAEYAAKEGITPEQFAAKITATRKWWPR